MSSAAAIDRTRTSVSSTEPGWIQSKGFDLTLFAFPALLTLPIVLASFYNITAIAVLGFFLAFAHYFSTLTFFFWSENHSVHRKRWLAFFAGPVLIAVLLILLVTFRVPYIIQVSLLFWNSFHVARQNCGILSIYRQAAGVRDVEDRNTANAAIISIALWLTLWNVGSNENVIAFFNIFSPRLVDILWLGFGTWAIYSLIRLGKRLWTRRRSGREIRAPELIFLLSTLVFFHPYLWIEDSMGATFVMLLPHFVQYLGIVWLIHRRRFASSRATTGERVLYRLSDSIPLLVVVLFSLGAALFVTRILMTDRGFGEHFAAFYLTVAFIHFYLDGLFWAFRDPHVRQTLGPYLVKRSNASTTA